MGPGIKSAGCGAWLDIFFGISFSTSFGTSTCFLTSSFFISGSFFLLTKLPSSSSRWADRSVEKGVLSSRKGLGSKCLLKRLRREDAEAREGATVTNEGEMEG